MTLSSTMANVCGVLEEAGAVQLAGDLLELLAAVAGEVDEHVGLVALLPKPARALEIASPVIAGGRAYTYHCSGISLVASAGLTTSESSSVVPSAELLDLGLGDALAASSVRASSLLSTGPTGRDSGRP